MEKGSDVSVENSGDKLSGNPSVVPGTDEAIKLEVLDSLTYEAQLQSMWDQPDVNRQGFDWEMEKLRRRFSGMELNDRGEWVVKEGKMDWTFSPAKKDATDAMKAPVKTSGASTYRLTLLDTGKVYVYNVLSLLGLGPALGMSKVPTAEIQKYEGSFFSFIKGVLGGDLQTLAGGEGLLLLFFFISHFLLSFYHPL